MANDLTEKQKRFCEEYLIDLNGTQAAIRAGYSEETARQIASENLAKLYIQEYISELTEQTRKALKISHEEITARFLQIANRCLKPEPLLKYNPRTKDYEQVVDENGDLIFQFDGTNANRAYENVAKHIGYYSIDNQQKSMKIVWNEVKNYSDGTNDKAD